MKRMERLACHEHDRRPRRGNGRVVDGWLHVANTAGFYFDIRARNVMLRATFAKPEGRATGGVVS